MSRPPSEVPEPNWLELWQGRRLMASGQARDLGPREIAVIVQRSLPDTKFTVVLRARWRVFAAWLVRPSFGPAGPTWSFHTVGRTRRLDRELIAGMPAGGRSAKR